MGRKELGNPQSARPVRRRTGGCATPRTTAHVLNTCFLRGSEAGEAFPPASDRRVGLLAPPNKNQSPDPAVDGVIVRQQP